MTDPRPTRLQLDSHAVQVLAHPLRSRILTRLRSDGPATATTLAAAFETNTGATSYHLRKLADVDLVVESHPGRGKERWWRASTESHSWNALDVSGDPDGEAASRWLQRHYLQQFSERYTAWIDEEAPLAWKTAATASDESLSLSPEQLTALVRDLTAVLDRYREPDDDPAADVRRVTVNLYAFPVAVPDSTAPGPDDE